MSLSECENGLLALYRRLRRELDPGLLAQMAGPFLSGTLEGYDPSHKNILLVGKATGGDWYSQKFTDTDTVQTIRDRTRSFLYDGDRSPFWDFHGRLDRVACAASGREPCGQHVIWTNLAKIGIKKGNPAGTIFHEQAEICRQLLLEEIDFYQPSLVVFVTSWYQHQLVHSLVGGDGLVNAGYTEEIEDGSDEFWYRARVSNLPPVLWCNHPQGKSCAILDAWEAKARTLLDNS